MQLMEIPTSIFNEISASMLDYIDLIPYTDEKEYLFSYDDNGFMIEGIVIIGGTWTEVGDGYFNQCETMLTDGWSSLDSLEVSAFNETTGELAKVSSKSVERLADFLDSELQKFMKHQIA